MDAAFKFSRLHKGGLAFDLEPLQAAVELRELADRIERRELLLNGVEVRNIIQPGEWAKTELVLVFHERDPVVAAEHVKLFGPLTALSPASLVPASVAPDQFVGAPVATPIP